jgi:hypothetical protein
MYALIDLQRTDLKRNVLGNEDGDSLKQTKLFLQQILQTVKVAAIYISICAPLPLARYAVIQAQVLGNGSVIANTSNSLSITVYIMKHCDTYFVDNTTRKKIYLTKT